MPDAFETQLRDSELADELRDYFRETSSTRRPPERRSTGARATSLHRRYLIEAVAAVGLAVVLVLGLWSASRGLDHRGGQQTTPTAPASAVAPAPTVNPQLLFERPAQPRIDSAAEIWDLPVAGGPARLIDTLGNGSSGPVLARLIAAGRRFVVTSDGNQVMSVADLSSGTSRVLAIGRVTSGALDPSQTSLAIRVFHGRGPADLDIVNLADMTVTRLRQMPLTAAMSPYRWLSDGIHAEDEDFSTGATRLVGPYVVDPRNGAISSALPSSDNGDYSQDGRVEAVTHLDAAGLPDAISVSVTGGSPHTVYTAAKGRVASVLAVSDDGSLLITDALANQTPAMNESQVVPTLLLITDGAQTRVDTGGTLLDGAVALPGHDFVIQVKTDGGTELRRVPPAGRFTVISGLPVDFGQLLGIAG